jgi:hypothetical protein
MKTKTFLPPLLGVAAITLLSISPTNAALLAYEPFDYEAATFGVETNGGFGFSGAWGFVTEESIAGGSLSTAGTEPGRGGHLTRLAAGGERFIRRSLNTPLGETGTTRYIGFLVRPEGTVGNGLYGGFFGVSLAPFTGYELFVGKPTGENSPQNPPQHLYVASTAIAFDPAVSTTRATSGQTAHLVLKAEFRAGEDFFTLYVNPPSTGAPPGSGFMKTNIDVGTVSGLTIRSSGQFSLDEIRVGERYEDLFQPPPLIITSQPVDAPARLGGDAVFSARATGPEAVSYQWWFNGAFALVGATNTSLQFIGVTAADFGEYSVVVRSGSLSVTSAPATLYRVGPEDLVVVNTNDSGLGSLRQAIIGSNLLPGPDRITFALPGSEPYTIRLGSSLPDLTGPVTIDGTTQPGFAGRPVVELTGSDRFANGLTLRGGHSLVRGLILNGFGNTALTLTGGGSNVVEGNFVGVDRTGTTVGPATTYGIVDYTTGTRIGGETAATRNLVSGCLIGMGLGGTNTLVQGNWVGTDVTGMRALSNSFDGIQLRYPAQNILIGGRTPAVRNVLSGNGRAGLTVLVSSPNRVEGNLIGLTADGLAPLGNGQYGVWLSGGKDIVIGGTEAGTGNIISGNRAHGIGIIGSGPSYILGNFIGTDMAGTAALGNAGDGIQLEHARLIVIGGAAPGARNIISGNGQSGVALISSDNNRVIGNYIGLDTAGTACLANRQDGVLVTGGFGNSSFNNLVGGVGSGEGNVISGNDRSGIRLEHQTTITTRIEGNLIGTDAAGASSIGNGQSGIAIIAARDNTIGGVTPAARNVISGNGAGVQVFDAAQGNQILGNYVGTDAPGSTAVPNLSHGIHIRGSERNPIGGTQPNAGNIISGNLASGVFIEQTASRLITIAGNLIGTDAIGSAALGNAEHGVHLRGTVGIFVGGHTAAGRNVISGNGRSGVRIEGAEAAGNRVRNNFIGADATGVLALGNSESGVDIGDGASGNGVGEPGPGRNLIAHNGAHGVLVRSGRNNFVRANSIRSNGGLGIELGLDGVTANDPGDADAGANDLQNAPSLTSVTATPGRLIVAGNFSAQPGTTYTLDFYSGPDCDASGFGEGADYAGTATIATDANGSAGFAFAFSNAPPADHFITATATDPAGNCSEFSRCAQAFLTPQLGAIRVADSLTISWPALPESPFVLETTTSLAPPIVWSEATNRVNQVGLLNTVSLDTSSGTRFFRLNTR